MPDERFVDVPGARLWTVVQGSGTPVIMCHGGPGMYDYLGRLADLLDHRATVVRYDQRACGLSTGTAEQTFETATSDLDAIRDAYGFDRCVVVGHSWGATLALAYAAAYPDRVSGVAHVCGTGAIADWKMEHKANVTRVLGEEGHAELRAIRSRMDEGTSTAGDVRREAHLVMRADVVGEQNAARAADDLLERDVTYNFAVNRTLNAAFDQATADGSFVASLERVRMPVVVVSGEFDPRPWRIGERLAAMLPNARFHLVKDAGHLPWYEKPVEVRDLLADFLETL